MSIDFRLSNSDEQLYDDGKLSVDGIASALQAKDPRVSEYIVKLAKLNPTPAAWEDEKRKEEVEDCKEVLASLLNDSASKVGSKRYPEQAWWYLEEEDIWLPNHSFRREQLKASIAAAHSEAWEPVAKIPEDLLPERFKLRHVLTQIFEGEGLYMRSMAMDIVRELPLIWGPWQVLKKQFKLSILEQNWELFGAFVARFETERSTHSRRTKPSNHRYHNSHFRDVKIRTLSYLLRRAWRLLAWVGRSQPTLYPEVAVEVLRHSTQSQWQLNTSIALKRILAGRVVEDDSNEILVRNPDGSPRHEPALDEQGAPMLNAEGLPVYTLDEEGREVKLTQIHKTYKFARSGTPYRFDQKALNDRAFAQSWLGSMDPLVRLFELAQSRYISAFAMAALTIEFEADLISLDRGFLLRLASSDDKAHNVFILEWITNYAKSIPPARYIEEGIHELILPLFKSSDLKCRSFAADYVLQNIENAFIRSNFDQERVMWLLRHSDDSFNKLAGAFLDPEKGYFSLTLDQWTELLEDKRCFGTAKKSIRGLFSASDLSLDWHKERIFAGGNVATFSMKLINEDFYREGDDFYAFYSGLIQSNATPNKIMVFALEEIDKFFDRIGDDFLRMMLIHPKSKVMDKLLAWIEEEKVEVERLGLDFLKCLTGDDEWEEKKWLSALGEYGEDWRDERRHQGFVKHVHGWLEKQYSPERLGYDWLLARFENKNSDYKFIRRIVQDRLPFRAFAADRDSDDADLQGCLKLFKKLFRAGNIDSHPYSSYKQLLLERYAKGDESLGIPPGCISYGLFRKHIRSSKANLRDFVRTFSDSHLSEWVERERLDFFKLRPYFFCEFEDVRLYYRAALFGPKSQTCRIDLDLPQFTVDSIYSYCSDIDKFVRDFGLSLILKESERYGQFPEILKLADSSDRRVRELVVRQLWGRYRGPSVTEHWRPYANSILEQGILTKNRLRPLRRKPLPGEKPSDIGAREKVVGPGVEAFAKPALDKGLVRNFLRRVLFRLPPKSILKEDCGREFDSYAAWRNKRDMLYAVRDVAISDADFAEIVLPLIQEFMGTQGKTEFEAGLVALTQIEHAHAGGQPDE
jgi:hypothetical protein